MGDILRVGLLVRRYSELRELDSFEERFEYLKLPGTVGHETFGFDRYLNQLFYKSSEWQRARREVIIRDGACDLGITDRPITRGLLIHHMNPITQEEVLARSDSLFNPEYLICTCQLTHNAIHYGDRSLLPSSDLPVRTPNDTAPWRII